MHGVVSKFVTGDENSHRFGRIPKGAMTGALWADVMQERPGPGVSRRVTGWQVRETRASSRGNQAKAFSSSV
jgi:hypothetical protein